MGTILQMPQRNKGRVRKSTDARSEGALAMFQFDTYPENVERIERAEIAEVDGESILAYLVEMVINHTPGMAAKMRRTSSIQAALHDSRKQRLVAAAAAAILRAS